MKNYISHLFELSSIAHLIKNRLWLQILTAMILGLALGLTLSPETTQFISKEKAFIIADWLKLPGTIFLNIIQMVVIPLITSSIILGISSGDSVEELKRLGLRIIPYFVFTTTVAVFIGVILSLYIRPGAYIDKSLIEKTTDSKTISQPKAKTLAIKKTAPERIAELIPTNIDKARTEKNMLQIVIFAIFVGIAVVFISKEQALPLIQLLECIQELSLKVVGWAMTLAPIAVFGLLADISIRVGVNAIMGMSMYVLTVILGLFILLAFYLTLVKLWAKQSPLKFLSQVREVQLLAFSTSSSAAVMPLSIKTAEEKMNISSSISKFIIPLGTTINMDGTAIYQVIAAVFLTQVFGIDLSPGQLITLAITTVGASIGSPSTPGVGIIILATLLKQIGVPLSGIGLIIGVDRILDMSRTAINVTGDLTACRVMERILGHESKS